MFVVILGTHQIIKYKGETMSEDKSKISEAIQLYFDSMYESSEEKVRQVFHKDAKITGYMQGSLMEQSVDEMNNYRRKMVFYLLRQNVEDGANLRMIRKPNAKMVSGRILQACQLMDSVDLNMEGISQIEKNQVISLMQDYKKILQNYGLIL